MPAKIDSDDEKLRVAIADVSQLMAENRFDLGIVEALDQGRASPTIE